MIDRKPRRTLSPATSLIVFFVTLSATIPTADAQENAANQPAGQGPNFVIFVADDMAWDDAGAYGNEVVRTPNIDRLAAQGMRFDRATLTCSSCSPSRCSMLTGRYPHNTGASELHLPLPADQTLLTTPLRQTGYWTAAVGKWHLGKAAESQVDYLVSSSPEKMGDAWVESLRKRPADKPFFLWAAHLDPHRPYPGVAADPPHDPATVSVPPMFPDNAEVRQDIADYYDEITRFDRHIGEVLAELETQGVAANTFILVISDNGRPFPDCKTHVDVPGVRTPFIVRWPSTVEPGTVCESVVSTVDIAATITQLAGAETIESFQGTSFVKLLHDPSQTIRPFAFAEHNWHDYRAFERAVHDRNYCYVRNWLPDVPGTPPADAVKSPTYRSMQRLHAAGKLTPAQRRCFELPRPTEMLFDVVADPNCLNNLAGEPASADALGRMRAALEDWQIETGDAFPGKDELTPDGFDRVTGDRTIKGSHPSR